jgi:hypothetical protein
MSTLVVDTLTGKSTAANLTIGSTPVVSSSANAMTIRGEGSNQTSIQQGLAKAWLNLIGTGTIAILDSFNISGITDDGTGLYDSAFSVNMNNNDYSAAAAGGESDDSGGNRSVGLRARATTGCNLRGFHDGSAATDLPDICVTMHGDLA